MSNLMTALHRDLYILEDESNPYGARSETIWPTTVLDQVFDQLSPTNKTLRTIIAELRQEIQSGGVGSITFPVTSVNGMNGDITITKEHLGLEKVDNTKDIDKPLSDPQRSAIMDILKNYDFDVDLSELRNHITNSLNPHAVTLEQINKDGEVTNFILSLIGKHNTSRENHKDIRELLGSVQETVDGISDNVEKRLAAVVKLLEDHCYDASAHATLFAKKEDVSNKVTTFTTVDHTRYPSTKAVVDYVTTRLNSFKDTLDQQQETIKDILVVNSRDDLPAPSIKTYQKVYFIRHGVGNNDEVAICRKDPGGVTYAWDISTFDTYSKFNPDHFEETSGGLSVKTRSIAEIIMSENGFADIVKGSLDKLIPDILGDYITKDEINKLDYIRTITVLPGTQSGTIRYYVNGNRDTMSEDVKVADLNTLAFLEKVTENHISENAVQHQHIGNKAIRERHLDDKVVSARTMKASYGTIFGNIEDSEGTTVREISLDSLAEILDPKFKVLFEEGDFLFMQEDKILELANKAFEGVTIHE